MSGKIGKGPVHFCPWGKSITPCGKRNVKKSCDPDNVTCPECLVAIDQRKEVK